LWANSVTLADASAFQAGKLIGLQRYIGSAYYYTHLAEITEVVGNVVKFQPSLMFEMQASDPSNQWIYCISPLGGLVVEGIKFTGANNPALVQRGLSYKFTRDARFLDLEFRDLTGAAGFKFDFSFGGQAMRLGAVNCGSPGESDLSFTGMGQLLASDLRSRFSGFGPQFSQCSGIHVSRVHSVGSKGRGIKLFGCIYSTFDQMFGNDSRSTGIAISGGSSYNSFSNLVACGNRGIVGNEVGVWFSMQSNKFNTINGLVAIGNAGTDITLYPTDDNNVIRQARYGTLYNTGANNTVSAT
jgi:hypothetical protein